MKKWKEHWNEMLAYEKTFEVAFWVFFGLFLSAFFFEILFTIGVMGDVLAIPFDVSIITTGLVALSLGCQTIARWRKERSWAIWSMILGIWWGLDAIWEIVKLFL